MRPRPRSPSGSSFAVAGSERPVDFGMVGRGPPFRSDVDRFHAIRVNRPPGVAFTLTNSPGACVVARV